MKKSKDLCIGCTENFYNGNNPYGVKECWCYKSATVCKRKFIPLDMSPPWKVPAQTTLSCHKKKGYVSVGEEILN